MTLKSDVNFKEKLTCGFKYYIMRNLVHFHPTNQNSKKFTSMGYFCPKYVRFEPEKYRGVIFHNTELWYKIWINPDLGVSEMAWRIWSTSIRAPKSLKKMYIDGFFLSKAYNVSVRKFQRSYVSWHWRVLQGKLTCGLKNGIMNLVNFHASSRKSENLHFNQILLSKAYKDLDEKAQKSYVSWHWRVTQSLKKNWLLIPKMTWGIWWILMRAVESVKICTLMGYFCRKYVMF